MANPKIEVEIAAKIDRLNSDFDKVYRMSQDTARRIDTAFGSVGGSFKSALAGMASVVSVSMFAGMIKGSVDAQDHLNDLSKSTSISVETLAGLGSAAKKSGGDLDSIAASINKLSVNIGKDPEKYKAIGVSAKEPIEAFKQLADVFNSIEDPQKRAAFGAEALGKSWAGAAPLLSEGGKKIGEMVERGTKLSQITTESAQAADELNDRLSDLGTTVDGFKNSLANNMAGPLTDVVKAIQETYEESGKLAALWMSMGALGAFFFTDEFSSAQVKIKNLQETLSDLNKDREAYNPFSVFGKSLKEIDADIANTTAQIEGLKKSMEPKAKLDAPVSRVPGLYSPGSGFTSDRDIDRFIGRDKSTNTGGKGTAEKVADLTASTKDYQATMESLSNTLLNAKASTNSLDSAQQALHKLMSSAEWETYSQAMQWSAIEQASFASGALSSAEAQNRLNDLMANTPTAQLEKATKDAELLENALSKAGSAADYQKIKEALDGVYESANRGTKAIEDQKDTGKEAFKELQQAVEGWGRSSADAFVEWASTGKMQFSDLVSSMLKDLAKMIVYQNVMKPLFSSFSESLSGSSISGMLGFGGGRATGGSVNPGNYYVVGEKGPELLIPNSSGTVIPNKSLTASASSGSGMSVQITQHISVDARADQSSVVASIMQAKESAKAEILASMQRGGVFARA